VTDRFCRTGLLRGGMGRGFGRGARWGGRSETGAAGVGFPSRRAEVWLVGADGVDDEKGRVEGLGGSGKGRYRWGAEAVG
jgi:hypothetical protein